MPEPTAASYRAALWPTTLLAYVFLVIMLGTTLPTPLYPDYQRQFGFGQLTETVVFAIYAAGVLATLLLFGRISDVVGRRPMLFAAAGVSSVSSVVFIIAESLHGGAGVALLLVGRFLSGLSAGIVTGTATAAIADAAPPGRGATAALVAAMSQICGLGLGPLVGGILLQNVADPLRVIYVIYVGLLVIAALAIAVVPETVHREAGVREPIVTPLSWRAVLAQANATGLVGFAGFAVLGLFTAVTPSFLHLLGWRAPIDTGLVVFSVFAASAVGQLATARVSTRVSVLAGMSVLTVGMIIVGYGLHTSSIPLLEVGGLIAGVGQGMSFHAALERATSASEPSRRSAAASGFFVICYLGISLPVVGLGVATRAYGLLRAGESFAVLVALIGVATVIVVFGRRNVHHP